MQNSKWTQLADVRSIMIKKKILTDLFRHMIGRRICEYFFYYVIFSGRQTFEEKLLFSLFAVKTVL